MSVDRVTTGHYTTHNGTSRVKKSGGGTMSTEKNLFKFHVNSMVALNNRVELQQMPPVRWEFQFPRDGGRSYVWDNVEVREVKLHAGLKIIVVLEGTYSDDIEDIAFSLADRILDIFSFVAMAQCDVPRLVSHISINNDGSSAGTFFKTPDPDSIIAIGTPRKIDKNIFKAVWKACNNNQAEQRVLLTLKWFRKATREKHIIDQFISYWIALEISNSTFRDILKSRGGIKPAKWGPAMDIFTNKIKPVGFEIVEKARNDIIHGNKPMSSKLAAKIRTYIVPVRNAAVYLLGNILCLDDTIADTIASNTTRRLSVESSTGLKGSFENLPTDMNELLKYYPEIITKGKPNQYSISDTGELNVNSSTDHTAKLPAKTKFHPDKAFVAVAKNTGVTGLSISKAALSDK